MLFTNMFCDVLLLWILKDILKFLLGYILAICALNFVKSAIARQAQFGTISCYFHISDQQ